jgi:ribosomal protein S18 acetylase RimI-like enzyme
LGPQVHVRDALPGDAEAIAELGRRAVPPTYAGLIDDPAVVEAIVEQSYAPDALRMSIERDVFLVAKNGSGIVGFLHYGDDELHRIYVEPGRKRQGIGSALLDELHRRLPAGSSYVLMVVAANHAAVAFYERHGLRETERVDGVAHMRAQMDVAFPAGTGTVQALILRFTKGGA